MKSFIQTIGVLLLLFPFAAFAKEPARKATYKRNVSMSFQVSSHATLNLVNKYGDINLYSWDKNQIRADVTITVKAQSEDQAKKIANGITIEKSQSNDKVSLHTNYNTSGSSSFWSMFFGEAGGRKNIRIDYKVYLPQSLGKLVLQNKYGNVAGNNIPGDMDLQLSYGHFHLSGLRGHLNLKVDYGDGSLTDIADGTIDAGYTDFRIDKAGDLKVHYKYSDFTIGEAGRLMLDGNYGDIAAENISELQSQTSYSDYKIQNLDRQGVIATAYGDVHINRSGDLKQLKITARYSDLFVGLSGKLPLKVKIQLKYGDFNSGSLSLQDVERVEKGSQTLYRGHSPGAGTDAALISINGEYSDVKFSEE